MVGSVVGDGNGECDAATFHPQRGLPVAALGVVAHMHGCAGVLGAGAGTVGLSPECGIAMLGRAVGRVAGGSFCWLGKPV